MFFFVEPTELIALQMFNSKLVRFASRTASLSSLRRVHIKNNLFHVNITRSYSNYYDNPNSNPLKWAGYAFVAIMGGSVLYQVYKSVTDENERLRPRTATEARIYNYIRTIKEYPCAYSIIGANILIFIIGRLAPTFAIRNLMLSLDNISARRYHTLLTSAFFHTGIVHLGINMYVFNSFNRVERELGEQNFLMVYFASAIGGSLMSLINKSLRRIPNASVGASAALYGVVGVYALMHPNARFGIIFIPSDLLNFKASTLLPLAAAFDFCGLFFRASKLDHAGHLGGNFFNYHTYSIGLLSGVALYYYFVGRQPKHAISYSDGRRSYRGEVTGLRTMHGKGELTVQHNGGTITYIGDFNNDNFVRGELIERSGKTVVYARGDFDNFLLKKGTIQTDNMITQGTYDKGMSLS
jgi:membrane associated rhomboid family serine protease